ncbi:MAG: VCBS repeat-containing protein [Planctomycetes bacterium]|nr:VCBS repeat-containing protein [Planctomycetota bacterium]
MKDHTSYPGISANRGRRTGTSLVVALLAIVTLSVLAACGGSGGSSGGSTLSAPVGAGIGEVVTRNPENVINAATATSVEVEVTLDSSVKPGDLVTVRLSDGVTEAEASAPAVAGSTITVGPIDASILADGPIELIVTMSNSSGSLDTSYGDVLFKDTVPPALPTAFELVAGAGNAANTVNLSNVAAADFAVSFDSSASAQDLVSILANDGTVLVTSPAANVQPSGTVTVSGVDLSALMDGNLTVDAEIVDPAANVTSFQILVGKDTAVPAILLVRVETDPGQPANTVTSANHADATVQVAVDSTAVTGDQVGLAVIDSNGGRVLGASQPAPVGGGSLYFGGLNLEALFDGSLTLEVTITDLGGNTVVDSSHTAMKVAQPTGIEGAWVAAGDLNAQNVINVGNGGKVYVDVISTVFQDGRGEQISAIFQDDNGLQVTSTPVDTEQGQDHMTLGPIDTSALADGGYLLFIRISDASGNVVLSTGTPGICDQTGPGAVAAFGIPVTGSGPADTVNSANQSNVELRFVLPTDADDLACELTVSDGVSDFVSNFTQPASASNQITSFLDLSAFADGPISFSLVITDPVGNTRYATGRPATKDTVAVLPASARVAHTSSNPADFINIASESNVRVDLSLSAASTSADRYQVIIQDGSASVASAYQNGAPNATLSFTGLNATALAEGTVNVYVRVVDAAGNQDYQLLATATKDVTAPVSGSAFVAAGAHNPMNVINSENVTATLVTVSLPNSVDPADLVMVVFTDGVNYVASEPTLATRGSSTHVVDTSVLSEGQVSLTVQLNDRAGNVTSNAGAKILKDLNVVQPTAAAVAAGNDNAADVINGYNVSSVQIQVTMPATADGSERLEVTLSDGSASLTSTAQAVPAGGGVITFSMDASGLADGSISLLARSYEVASGNSALTAGTPATKDATAPAMVDSVVIPAQGSAPMGWVNGSTFSATDIDLSYSTQFDGSEQVTCTLVGAGGASLALGSFTPNTTGTVVNFSSLDLSAFADGSLSMTVAIVDPAGNRNEQSFPLGAKDSVAPESIGTLTMVDPHGVTQSVINADYVTGVIMVAAYESGQGEGDQARLSFSDGSLTVTPALVAYDPMASAWRFGVYDLSGLADGTITITGTITDPAGNSVTFAGGSQFKDATAPAAAVSANVVAGAQNGTDEINSSSVTAVSVDVALGASSVGDEQVRVRLSDGSTTVTSPWRHATDGVGVLTFGPADCSAFADGNVTVTVELRDPSDNTTLTAGTVATKDTTIVTASAASIPAAPGNLVNRISSANASSVQVDVTIPATADGSEMASVTLSDGSNPDVTDGPQAVSMGGGSMSFSGLDCSGLADGSVTVTVTITDGHGNSSQATLLTATKDVAAPAQPTAAKVVATMNNADHYINAASETAVSVELTFPVGSNADDVATVTLDDGSASVTGQINAPAGGGTVTVTGINSSTLGETTITVSVDMVDGAGNTSGPFAGSSATKDVTAPASPVVDPVTSPWAAASQVLTGTNDANTDVVITGGAAQATAASDAGGHFAVTVTLTASTTNSLTVVARDAAGNTSGSVTADYAMAALDILQDATAPAAPFSDVTVAAGLGSTGAADGGAFADFDNDGDLDLFVGQAGAGIMYQYDSMTGTYTDVTGSLGVVFAGDRCAVWGDYDNDGDKDLLTVDSTAGTKLYRNDIVGLGTMTFTDDTVAEGAGIAVTTLTQAFWLDHDNDGWLDFIVLDATMNNNYLMSNQRGAGIPANSFLQDASTGVDASVAASRLGAVADFDVDGDVDLIIGDNTPGLFYRDDGATYTDIAGATSNVTFDHSAGGRGIVFADYDNDGDFDVFIARGGASSVNQLWRNDGGSSFTEVAALAGIDTDVAAHDVCFGDLDNDGILDLYVGSDTGNKLYMGVGDTNMDNVWEFVEVASDLGVGVDDANDADLVQMADIDDDGDLDLFVGNEGAADVLYLNGLDNVRFLKVRVSGQGAGLGTSSTDALGAVVILKDATNAIVATREISGGRGVGSQDCAEVHFGGITPSQSYTVEVHFVSGNMQTATVTPKALTNYTVSVSE